MSTTQQRLNKYQDFFNIQSKNILTAFNNLRTNCLEDLKYILPTNNKRTKLQIDIHIDYIEYKLKIFTSSGTLLEFSVGDILKTGDTRLHKPTPVYSIEAYRKLRECFIKLGYKNLFNFQKF